METRLGTNGPFWSLSYEAAYYALFAIAFFMRGVRRIGLLALGAWLVGVNILILLPVWLMGVALHRMLQGQVRLSPSAALGLTILPVAIYVWALGSDLPSQLYAVTAKIDASIGLRFSNEPLWNYPLGLLACAHLFGVSALFKAGQTLPQEPLIKWLAGASFSLYLIHYPLLQLLSTLPLGGIDGWTRDGVVLAITFLACFAFATLFERPLKLWRDVARGLVLPVTALKRS